MIEVRSVSNLQVHQVWPDVVDFIKASTDTGVGDCTPDQYLLLLSQGVQQLLVAVENDDIIGAMIVEVISVPNARVANIVALGGKGVVSSEVFGQVENWARANGATKFRAWAKDAQARLYRQRAGFTTARIVVEKQL